MTDIGIDLHLMTRGSSRDYRFIGKGHVDRWWSEYEKWTRVEAPTIIVESHRFYLSGIISTVRRDRVGTPIRYSIAGDLRNTDGLIEPKAIRIVVNLLAKAAAELEEKKSFAGLAELFDKIDNKMIEKALEEDDEASANVIAEVEKQLQALPDAAPCVHITERQWCSGLTQDGLRALIATAESVLKSRESNGLAAYLNLADEMDAQLALSRGRFGGIVVKDGPRHPKALARPLISPAVGLSVFLIAAGALAVWWFMASNSRGVSKTTNASSQVLLSQFRSS